MLQPNPPVPALPAVGPPDSDTFEDGLLTALEDATADPRSLLEGLEWCAWAGPRTDPDALTVADLIRTGSDDVELGRLIRDRTLFHVEHEAERVFWASVEADPWRRRP
ncbi:MAG: hypothetical protein ACREQ5_05015 [Candidatus Dormibacteria bacterium]